ncbi:IS1634 family transposase [Oxyplasma meridianum]|uniref:IS1634 family transposase n=1 Tax=Oxyplasma meridianum TaxID=3073602 RepID=A0AAX4NHM4_9ARCH
MAIKRHKKGNKVYLAEYKSKRVNGKVVSTYVRYIGRENADKTVKKSSRSIDRIESPGSTRAGDVDLLWAIAQDLAIPRIIDEMCLPGSSISTGKVLTAWAINRVVDPESATQLESWVRTTDIPRLAEIEEKRWTKDLFLDSLDAICYDESRDRTVDLSPGMDAAIYDGWRKKHPVLEGEKFAYDLTTVLFFGTSCPLAEFGYNPNHENRRQINIALMVSVEDHQPEYHAVFEGSRTGVTTVKNMLAVLPKHGGKRDTIIWDRGNISRNNLDDLELAEWYLISGIPKSVKQIREILSSACIDPEPGNFVRKARSGSVYAHLVHADLYGKKRNIAVYLNAQKRLNESDERNTELARIGRELDDLSRKPGDMDEQSIHRQMEKIVGSYSQYIEARVSRKGEHKISWRYRRHAILASERLDGKSAILCTDPSLKADEIVNLYLGKDYVEKVFRTMKTQEEITPVRHHLERSVKAYVFVMVTAYRLMAALVSAMKRTGHEEPWESAADLLDRLARVERIELTLGKEKRTWYLNMKRHDAETLNKMGFGNIFNENERSK